MIVVLNKTIEAATVHTGIVGLWRAMKGKYARALTPCCRDGRCQGDEL